MNKETTNTEEDFNINELLGEEEDSPVEVTEEPQSIKLDKKSKGKLQGSTKKKEEPEIPDEIAQINKELANMEWQPYTQPAYEGLQNIKTGELIDDKEILRRTLCYAQEAARNSI